MKILIFPTTVMKSKGDNGYFFVYRNYFLKVLKYSLNLQIYLVY